MTKEKTRPTDNFHCFTGMGRPLWLSVASGFQQNGIIMDRDGARVDLLVEGDGNVIQNGGMQTPQETKVKPGVYFRFFGSRDFDKHGGPGCMSGPWWVDFENAMEIKDWAIRYKMPLSEAAAALLVIPPGWHDCGYVGRAVLQTTMKAWVGHGKPATGTVSPDSAARKASGASLHAAPPARSLKQYYIPGGREMITSVFKFDKAVEVTKKGKFPPGL